MKGEEEKKEEKKRRGEEDKRKLCASHRLALRSVEKNLFYSPLEILPWKWYTIILRPENPGL